MSQELDRDELHQRLQEQDLITILDTMRGQSDTDFSRALTEFGTEVQKSVDPKLITQMKNPLDADHEIIGVIALVWEAENDERVEEELDRKRKL